MFWIDAKSAASGFAAAASILVLAGGAGARELHVSPKEIEGFAGQHRTIQEVAKAARAGDTVVLHAGTYREYVLVDKGGSKINPVRFAAATGEKVVVTGADLLQELRRCVFQDNGQLGFGACRAHDMLITGCLVRNNNVKDYNRGWEAGGDKLVLCRGAVIEKSQFVGNRGNGIWFDINDGRHWPKAMQGAEYGGPAPEDIAAAYGAKDDANKPVGLSLEKLNLRFEKKPLLRCPGAGPRQLGRDLEEARALRDARGRREGARSGNAQPRRAIRVRRLLDARFPRALVQPRAAHALLPARRCPRCDARDDEVAGRSLAGSAHADVGWGFTL